MSTWALLCSECKNPIGVYEAPEQSTRSVLCPSCDIRQRVRERRMFDGTPWAGYYDPMTETIAGVALRDIYKMEREEKFGVEGL